MSSPISFPCVRIASVSSYLLDLRVEGIKIQPDIYAGGSEGLHAAVVVGGGIDVVNAYRIGANRLHELRVELALRVVNERVVGDELVCDSYRGQWPAGEQRSIWSYP